MSQEVSAAVNDKVIYENDAFKKAFCKLLMPDVANHGKLANLSIHCIMYDHVETRSHLGAFEKLFFCLLFDNTFNIRKRGGNTHQHQLKEGKCFWFPRKV